MRSLSKSIKIDLVHAPFLSQIHDYIGYAVALGIFYLLIRWNKPRRAQLEKATVTTKTKTKVSTGVYNLPTLEKDVKTIKITNPYRHTLVAGGPGSGKSYSIIEPMLVQAMKEGRAGLIYDFKFPTLASSVATAAKGVTPYYINFDNLNQSHRVNPIHPAIISHSSYADQFAQTVIYNLLPRDSSGNASFFTDSAQGYLSAIFWFLREEYPDFCTLPHAIALANQDPAQVVALLETNEETRGTIAPIREALKSDGQRAAIVGTLQNGLRKINTKEIVWVLSGNDFTLDLNNPAQKKALVLGNNAEFYKTYGPILALLATAALKQMNQRGKAESIVILDEFPTLFIPNFDTYPATARSNKIAIVVGVQDISQIEEMYGKNVKNAILGILSNQFYGQQNNLDSAKYVSELWGKEDVQATGISESQSTGPNQNGNAGTSNSLTERQRIKVQDVSNLAQGQFFGKIVESDFSTFKAQIKSTDWEADDLQDFTTVTQEEITANYRRIQQEVRGMLDQITTIPPPLNGTPIQGQNGQPKPKIDDEF